jgi:hypothetical protein
MAKEMKFPGPAIVPGSLAPLRVDGKPIGLRFDLRLKYYRGLFLSCVDEFTLTLDGAAVPAQDVWFCLGDKEFPAAMLPQLVSEFWHITDRAQVCVHRRGGLAAGEHRLALRMMLRSPYLPNFDAASPARYVPINNCDEVAFVTGEGGIVR